MLQFENLFLAVAIVVGAYVWSRAGLRTPRVLGLPHRTTRRAVVAFGWVLLVGITVRSAAAVIGDGRVQVSKSGQYAYRAREPGRFWGEIAGDMLLVGAPGIILILLGRRSGSAARDA